MFLMGEQNKGLYFRNTTKKKPKQLACISSYKSDFRTSLGFVLSRNQEMTTAIPTSNRTVFPKQAQLEGRGAAGQRSAPISAFHPCRACRCFLTSACHPVLPSSYPISAPQPSLQAVRLGGIGTQGCLSLGYKMFPPISDVSSFKRAS